jgi:uncharacterized hydrophobic protein (TIGR00271 family)
MTKSETSAIEEAAGEQLGVESWDRPAIFRECADAAIDSGLPYWLVLVLSGAIATLGLALDSSAVVIGAMLVAPLLAPIVGLALSLAVGDGRLAVQAAAVVAGSTLAVVVVAALLTMVLPFQTITLEISARARPTTLDLAIAIFSGLVGAVVTVGRGSRLSAAIPGVAISVALIPPLAVAGFGVGIGWNAELIRGSMLLYGANLAGIVLSGMAVFLMVGMHRPDVVAVARKWRDQVESTGLAAWADRPRWVRSLGVVSSAWARVALVGAFVVALGFPLSESLTQIAREARVERAIEEVATALYAIESRVSILNRQVIYGSDRTQVYLRVATTAWLSEEAREDFERRASARAGEPVRLTLEQIPTRGEDLDQLTSLLGQAQARTEPAPPAPPPLPDLLAAAGERLRRTLETVSLPDGVYLAQGELGATASGGALLRVTYAAAEPLPAAAEVMLRRQLGSLLDLPAAEIRLSFTSTEPRTLTGEPADSLVLGEIAEILVLGEHLSAEILEADTSGAAAGDAAARWLTERGIDSRRVRIVADGGGGTRIKIAHRAPAPMPAGAEGGR